MLARPVQLTEKPLQRGDEVRPGRVDMVQDKDKLPEIEQTLQNLQKAITQQAQLLYEMK